MSPIERSSSSCRKPPPRRGRYCLAQRTDWQHRSPAAANAEDADRAEKRP